MNGKTNSQTEQLDGCRENTPASRKLSPPNVRRMRLKRVDEYESLGLAKSEPFEALMAAVQAGLSRDACESEDAVKLALANHTAAQNISELEPAIKRHLNVVRRIVRNARLEIRADSART